MDITLTLSAYWQDKLKDPASTNSTHLTELQKEFESIAFIAMGLASTPVVALHVFFGHLASVKSKSLTTLVGVCVVNTSMVVMALVNSSYWQRTFMVVSLVQIVLINIFRSFLRASISVNLGKFPVDHISSFSKKISLSFRAPEGSGCPTGFYVES